MKNFLLVILLLVSQLSRAQTTTPSKINTDTTVYDSVEQMPKFPGGNEGLINYFRRNLRYPKLAMEANIQGQVIISFVVNKDGTISTIKIIKDIGGGCGDEAVRAVRNMPAWTPGMKNKVPVNVRFYLPVQFLDTDEADSATATANSVETKPQFQGGQVMLMKFLVRNIHYPAAAKQKKIQGTVEVSFAVNKDGTISSVKLLNDIGGGCGDELVRVVKLMPVWIPGTMKGKPVKMTYTLPFNFQLNSK